MQLTRFSDYALRVLMYVALRPDEWVTIKQISDAYGISRNHLMKVVSFLGSKGYLLSQRGPGGGVRLKLMPNQVGLADVIRDTEGNLNLLNNAESPIGHERLSVVFADAMDAFLLSLNQSSLADLIEPREELSRQLGIAR